MNFIAAMFLTFLSEEESFWLLVIVMNEEPYKLRELFGEDMAGTHEVLYIAEKLLQQFLPKLSQHFETESIHISMFVTQWLLTVYTSTFPFELVSRVWDSFLVEGWKVVYRVMLALMEAASKDIMNYSFEQILNYFRDFPHTVDGTKIMNASLKIPLKRKHIQKHVTEWRRGNAEEHSKTSSGIANPFRRRDSAESNMSGTIKSHGEGSKNSKTSSSMSRFKKRGSRDITVEDFTGQLLPIIGASKFAVMINNVLSPEECEEIIHLAEGSGFHPAAIYDAATKTVHRNCTRHVIDDTALAENWFERILHALNDTPHEQKVKECPWIGNKQSDEHLHAVSLNERLRVIKYAQGQFYTKHQDAAFTRGSEAGDREGEKSLVSVHLYLNEGYKGGVTRFHGGGRWFDVKTKAGSVLLFESTIPHEAVKVTKGEKYVVRSDIMYSTKTDLMDVAGTGFTQQL
jgi:predicted 2-oxoglutarate/Fe(II)-dependent dioxygenase YbiX